MGAVLMLERDNVVIGAGLSGLVAAMRLKGSTLLLSYGMAATAISTGVLSYPASRDVEAEKWLLSLLSHGGCPYVNGICMTDHGVLREGLMQDSTNISGSPRLVAFNTEKQGQVSIEFMKGRSLQEIAKVIETDDKVLDELVELLKGVDLDHIVVPPVLGISRASEIRKIVSDAIGSTVHEYVTAPSALGLRLVMALKEKARDQVDCLDLTKIDRIGNGLVEGRMGTKGRRELRIKAGNLVIATGGLMTGFRVSGDRLYEPLTGVTVSEDFESCLDRSFLARHPLMYTGIGSMPLNIDGFKTVRAVGATASGFGLYGALTGGYRVGDSE
jgi:glycerol-3-phosphate dehydrogenase subunit B